MCQVEVGFWVCRAVSGCPFFVDTKQTIEGRGACEDPHWGTHGGLGSAPFPRGGCTTKQQTGVVTNALFFKSLAVRVIQAELRQCFGVSELFL